MPPKAAQSNRSNGLPNVEDCYQTGNDHVIISDILSAKILELRGICTKIPLGLVQEDPEINLSARIRI
jgi:hypothetical protein